MAASPPNPQGLVFSFSLFPTDGSQGHERCANCGELMHTFESEDRECATLICCLHCLNAKRQKGQINLT